MRTTPARRAAESGAADTGNTATHTHRGGRGGADARAVGAATAPTQVGAPRAGGLRGRSVRRRTGAGLAAAVALAAAAVAGCASGGSSATGAGTPTGAPGSTSATAPGTSAAPTGSSPGTPTGAPGGGSSQCTGGTLHTTSASAGVASGHVGLILTFTNTGPASCTLTGYPGAALVGANAQVLMNASRTLSGFLGGAQGYADPPSVTLAPGAPASALLEWADVPTGDGAATTANCPGMGASQLQVTPPDTTATVSMPSPGTACGGLQIHPVLAGSTGRTPGT